MPVTRFLTASVKPSRGMALNAKQAQQSRNHILGVTMAIIGSVVLLGANLITERANTVKPTAEIAAEQPEVPASGLPPEQ